MKIINMFLMFSLLLLKMQHSHSFEDCREEEKPIKIVYGCLWPEGHFGREVAQEFANKVTRETSNNIIVEITPPSTDLELTQKVIKGEIQMTSGHAIQEYVPEIGLTYSPYLYNSFEHFRQTWTLGNSLASDTIITRAEQSLPSVKILGYSLIGYRDIILRRGSIRNIEDFKNLRIRVDGSISSIKTFEAFEATPITIEYHQVKEALKNGEIDAAENSPFNLIYMGWHEECKNISLTKHLMLLNVEIINTAFWNKLPTEYQEIIRSAMQDAVKNFSDTASKKRNKAITDLRDKYKLSVDEIPLLTRGQLINKVMPMKLDFVKKYNLEDEYEDIIKLSSAYS